MAEYDVSLFLPILQINICYVSTYFQSQCWVVPDITLIHRQDLLAEGVGDSECVGDDLHVVLDDQPGLCGGVVPSAGHCH